MTAVLKKKKKKTDLHHAGEIEKAIEENELSVPVIFHLSDVFMSSVTSVNATQCAVQGGIRALSVVLIKSTSVYRSHSKSNI